MAGAGRVPAPGSVPLVGRTLPAHAPPHGPLSTPRACRRAITASAGSDAHPCNEKRAVPGRSLPAAGWSVWAQAGAGLGCGTGMGGPEQA